MTRKRQRLREAHAREALLTWWMPLPGLAIALGFALWNAVSREDAAVGERLGAFGANLLWPGLLIAAVVSVIVWAAWKLELD